MVKFIFRVNPLLYTLLPIFVFVLWIFLKNSYESILNLFTILFEAYKLTNDSDIIYSLFYNSFINIVIMAFILSYFFENLTNNKKNKLLLSHFLLLQENEIRKLNVKHNALIITSLFTFITSGIFTSLTNLYFNYLSLWYDDSIFRFFSFTILLFGIIFVIYVFSLLGGATNYLVEHIWLNILSFQKKQYASIFSILSMLPLSFIIFQINTDMLQLFNPIYISALTLTYLLQPEISVLEIIFRLGYFILLLYIFNYTYSFIFKKEIKISDRFSKSTFSEIKKPNSGYTYTGVNTKLAQFLYDFKILLRNNDLFEFSAILFSILVFITYTITRDIVSNETLQFISGIITFIPIIIGMLGLIMKFGDIGMDYLIHLSPYTAFSYTFVKHLLVFILVTFFSTGFYLAFYILEDLIGITIPFMFFSTYTIFSGFLALLSSILIVNIFDLSRNDRPYLSVNVLFILVTFIVMYIFRSIFEYTSNIIKFSEESLYILIFISISIISFIASLFVETKNKS